MKWMGMVGLFLALMVASPAPASAGRADPFKGQYDILSEHDKTADQNYFLLDADTLGNIWAKYATTPLPADLEKYRNEPSILAGFSNRDTLFLTLERAAMIVKDYLSIQDADGNRLELKKRPDGQSDMAVTEGSRVTFYLLGPPRQIP